MLEQGLVDELHLLVHPIVVGHGKRLFDDGKTVPLELLSTTTLDTGVVHLVYTAPNAVDHTAHADQR
jgi:dihydrofolate reductase